MPNGIVDRNADVWEALLMIADAAGGDWPERARVSAVTLVTAAIAATPSLGVRLLADLRTVFSENPVMSTHSIIDALIKLDESPWGDLRGKPLDARRLSNLLKPYGVERTTVRAGYEVAKGYRREDLHDAWTRYLQPPVEVNQTKVTRVTEATHDLPGVATKESVASVTSVAVAHCAKCLGEGCAWCERVSESPAPARVGLA
jgi:Protein of unknown function (DUF3631)